MKNKLLHDPVELLGKTSEDLREILIDPKYNKANLRELVRRTIYIAKVYKEAFEYERERAERLAENGWKTDV